MARRNVSERIGWVGAGRVCQLCAKRNIRASVGVQARQEQALGTFAIGATEGAGDENLSGGQERDVTSLGFPRMRSLGADGHLNGTTAREALIQMAIGGECRHDQRSTPIVEWRARGTAGGEDLAIDGANRD